MHKNGHILHFVNELATTPPEAVCHSVLPQRPAAASVRRMVKEEAGMRSTCRSTAGLPRREAVIGVRGFNRWAFRRFHSR
jgi:hypothetical protein